jgi:hypothetical protein
MPARLLYKSKETSQYCLPKNNDTVCHHNHVAPQRFNICECCSFWLQFLHYMIPLNLLVDSNEAIDLESKVDLILPMLKSGLVNKIHLSKKGKRML